MVEPEKNKLPTGQTTYFGDLAPPTSLAEAGQMLRRGANPIIAAVGGIPAAVGAGVQTAAYPFREVARGFAGAQKTPTQLAAEAPPMVQPAVQSTAPPKTPVTATQAQSTVAPTQSAAAQAAPAAQQQTAAPSEWNYSKPVKDYNGIVGTYGQTGKVTVEPGTGSPINPNATPTLADIGNYNIRNGTVGGGTVSMLSGPGRGNMSDDQWNQMPVQERIARNVAGYEAAAQGERQRYNQRVAAMDGRELDAKGNVIGPDRVTVIPDSEAEERQRRHARMELGSAMDAIEKKGRGYAELALAKARLYQTPAQQGEGAAPQGEGAAPQVGDFLKMLDMQESARHNQATESQAAQRDEAQDTRAGDTFGLANAKQRHDMMRARQEDLNAAMQNSGLSTPMLDIGRSLATQYPNAPADVILQSISDVANTTSGDPGRGWNPWAANKKFGELEKFDKPQEVGSLAVQRLAEYMKQREGR